MAVRKASLLRGGKLRRSAQKKERVGRLTQKGRRGNTKPSQKSAKNKVDLGISLGGEFILCAGSGFLLR